MGPTEMTVLRYRNAHVTSGAVLCHTFDSIHRILVAAFGVVFVSIWLSLSVDLASMLALSSESIAEIWLLVSQIWYMVLDRTLFAAEH